MPVGTQRNGSAAKSSVNGIHRPPPHSAEAEQGVLGSMLENRRNSAIPEAALQIGKDEGEWFYVPAHQTIYRRIIDIWETGKQGDIITLTQRLRDVNELESVGGASFVTSLITLVPTTANVGYYLEILRDKRTLRRLIRAGTEAVRRAYEEQGDVANLITEVSQLCAAASNTTDKAPTIKELVADVLDHMDTKEALGISTGYPALDEIVGGFCKGEKIVIAGPMKGGKSAFAENLIDSFAVNRKIPTAVFSFEMSARQVVQRLIQIRSGVSTRAVARGRADMMDVSKYSAAATEIADAPLFIVKERLGVAGIRARCMQLQSSSNLQIVVIDYAQIIPEPREKGEGTVERLDRVSIATKQIASQLGLILIELSQLTEKQDGTFNTKWSSGITADCDKRLDLSGEDDEDKRVIEKHLHVSYQREGPRGTVDFRFDKPTTRFKEKELKHAN